MKTIGVIANRDKDIGYNHTKVVIENLLDKGFEVLVPPGIGESIDLPARTTDSIYNDSDFVICIGGDGTFLNVARKAYYFRKPILGINKGTVGFLAEVEVKDIGEAINRLARGDYIIQPRMVLDVEVWRKGEKVYSDIAINDAVVSRTALSRILRLKVMMDNKYVDSFPGDGVIVSTPTGSTGYTLSTGGPIIQPDMRLMVFSPICPHILYSRSFIVPESTTVQISIDKEGELDAMLTSDGQNGFKLQKEDEVRVMSSGRDILFASVCDVNFYDVLRAKIRGN
ncbi:MAG: NAD(+)/NADH kinase [Clostridiaceae bacterium]|nr:NAD(+)/NADH kinase [Clostridiaceae bacterium]